MGDAATVAEPIVLDRSGTAPKALVNFDAAAAAAAVAAAAEAGQVEGGGLAVGATRRREAGQGDDAIEPAAKRSAVSQPPEGTLEPTGGGGADERVEVPLERGPGGFGLSLTVGCVAVGYTSEGTAAEPAMCARGVVPCMDEALAPRVVAINGAAVGSRSELVAGLGRAAAERPGLPVVFTFERQRTAVAGAVGDGAAKEAAAEID